MQVLITCLEIYFITSCERKVFYFVQVLKNSVTEIALYLLPLNLPD